MLFTRPVLEAIAAGRVDLAFRRGAAPPARTGRTQVTAVGVIAFDAVDQVALEDVTEDEARRAGFADRSALLAGLAGREGPVHRITLRLAGPDPRVVLGAAAALTPADIAMLRQRLNRMDAASPRGDWTRVTLAAIARQPGRRASDLAAGIGWETAPFKAAVRRLKALGLTESLAVGYRLSARGRALLSAIG